MSNKSRRVPERVRDIRFGKLQRTIFQNWRLFLTALCQTTMAENEFVEQALLSPKGRTWNSVPADKNDDRHRQFQDGWPYRSGLFEVFVTQRVYRRSLDRAILAVQRFA